MRHDPILVKSPERYGLDPWLRPAGVIVAVQGCVAIAAYGWSGYGSGPALFDCLGVAVLFFMLGLVTATFVDCARLIESPTRLADARRAALARIRRSQTALAAMLLLGFAMAFANWSKSMIPGFEFDETLANLDLAIFGVDPWQLFRVSWLARPFALSYVYWFPITVFTLLALLFNKPTVARQAALLSFFAIFLIGGTIGHFIMPSAGPIFYERIGLGDRFSTMLATNDQTYNFFADYLWWWHTRGEVAIGTGISAMPSMHVAVSGWLIYAGRSLWPPLAYLFVAFFLVIWAASIASGWHYATDGLVGGIVAAALIYSAKAGLRSSTGKA